MISEIAQARQAIHLAFELVETWLKLKLSRKMKSGLSKLSTPSILYDISFSLQFQQWHHTNRHTLNKLMFSETMICFAFIPLICIVLHALGGEGNSGEAGPVRVKITEILAACNLTNAIKRMFIAMVGIANNCCYTGKVRIMITRRMSLSLLDATMILKVAIMACRIQACKSFFNFSLEIQYR